MKRLKLLAIFSILLTINNYAATISGNTYCDLNNNGFQDADEVCSNEAVWVKVLNIAKNKLIAQEPLHPSGEFTFHINATGDFLLFIDNNSDTKDSTPTPPANTLFAENNGSIEITIVGPDDVSAGNKLGLIPDPVCSCDGKDGIMLNEPITIDGVMDDWANINTDPDNTQCDSGTIADYDINRTQIGRIQSTGRNLVRFSRTVNPALGLGYAHTTRVGQSSNEDVFLFYRGGYDGRMHESIPGPNGNGSVVLTASWHGTTGIVKMEACEYVAVDKVIGDPMSWQLDDVGELIDVHQFPAGATVPLEWVGQTDGYTIPGTLSNCAPVQGLEGKGSADGVEMEFQIPLGLLGLDPALGPPPYHVSSSNTAINDSHPPAGIDDNMGPCLLAALPEITLDVNKTVDNTTPRVGENVTYTITVTNTGDPSSSIVIEDLLPVGVTYVSHSGADWNCTITDQNVTCNYEGLIGNGTSASLEIVALVTDDTALWGETLTNTVCTNSDENTTLVCDDENITVYTPETLLEISKTVTNPTPLEGESILYEIAVTNTGPDIANNVVVNDILPLGVVYLTSFSTDSNWTCTELSNTLNCSFARGLNAGETAASVFITVSVTGTAGSTYTNEACTHSDENLTDVCNSVDIVPAAPPVIPVLLTIEKGVSESTPLIGETIVYGIVVTNVGTGTATNVELNDTLPTGLTFVSYETTPPALPGAYDAGTGIWSGFDLVSGGTVALLITATVNTDVAIGDTVTNTACISADGLEVPTCTDENLTVREPNVELLMDKVVDNENPRVGENVTYTLVVTNTGNDTANNVVVDDPLPFGVTEVSSSSLDYANPTWTVGTLAPGASSELNITVSVDALEGVLISNLACVDADENTTLVCDDANLTVYTPIIELHIQKIAAPSFPSENDLVDYTIIVINTGEDNASNISVTDTLPDGVTYVNAGGNGWVCDDAALPDLVCTNDTLILEPFIPSSFDINVTVDPDTSGLTMVNTVCIDEDVEVQTCAEANITVNQDLDLAVTKEVNNTTPFEGEVITYTISVTNNGPINATGVEVSEDIFYIPGLTNVMTSEPLVDDDTWEVGDLDVNATATLTVTATVASGAASQNDGIYTNFAAITDQDQNDINGSNNRAGATITAQPLHLGDYVWYDDDHNGIQNSGEETASGIKVELLDVNGSLVEDINGISTQYTDVNGRYGFDVSSGIYSVRFSGLTENNVFTLSNIGDETTDSDADSNGYTQSVTVSGGNYLDLDAGIYCLCLDVQSDGSPAMGKVSSMMMILMTIMLGLFFIRREELYRNKR